ncbi:MAG: ABC transporter ATP-binding protein [Nakamurella sp.]
MPASQTTTRMIPPQNPAGNDHVLRALDLRKTYGTDDTLVRALDGVDVDFRRGSFTAVMGPSGSGKSTLMHCLAGLDAPTSGSIRLGDVELTTLDDRALTGIRRDRFGFVFQSFNLLPMLTAAQNILLPLELAGRSADPDHYRELTAALRISDRLQHRPSELSGGQQQRVAIARAMITRPDIVFADEPTGALDTRTGHQLLAFLRAGARELGQTIVMVTHDPVAAAYADRAVLLSDGRVAGSLQQPTADDVLAAMRDLGA